MGGFGGGADGCLAVLAQAYVLVSWWKAVLLLLPFVPWAWLVSGVFDKHANRFFLGQERWAAIHTAAGLAALVAGFFMPIPAWWGFIVAFLAVLVILGADIAAFVAITNTNENVPEKHRLKLDFSALAEARKAKAEAKQQGTVTLEIKQASGAKLTAPGKETPEFEVRIAAEDLFNKALAARAAQVDVLPTSKEGVYGVRHLIDGVYQAGEQVAAAQAVKLIDFWKSCAGLDVNDRRRKLSGFCTVSKDDVATRVRATSSGLRGGIKLNLTFNPEKAVTRALNDTGMLPTQVEAVGTMGPAGVVLVAAKGLQGGTTTLYALLKKHDAYTSNVQTVETDVTAPLEGIRQVKYEPGSEGVEYSTTVRSILRRDPDVLGLAELPDAETAKEVARADTARTRIYVSLNTDNALSAVQMYVKAVGDPASAAKGLAGVTAQRLVRKLCTNCRVPYQPPAATLQKLGMPADKVKQLFKKGGQVLIRNKPETCPVCRGNGFDGQTGLFEVYPIGDEERAAIRDGDWTGLRNAWKKRPGLPGISQVALRRAAEGVTSIEEVQRVTAPPAAAGAKPGAAKPVAAGAEEGE